MNISYDWLKDYVDVSVTPDELAERLTLLGFEVDGMKRIGPPSLDGVIVGKVLDVRSHPDADRLVVCDVDLGGSEPSQIVCGAPNVAAGQLVPVAVAGTTLHLPDRDNPKTRIPITLRKAKIRGQISNGMICAEDELGLSDDHSGIMVLDEEATIGMPFAEYLGDRALSDTVFDIELTPNRPDGTCHIGIAREVAAYYGLPLSYPADAAELPATSGNRVRVDIENPDGCGRYVGILVTGVTVAPSPAWLVRRMEAVGLRSRNNIVDITNYVMFELGQPLHAFDYDRLAEGRIVVRNASDGMAFTTLDDTERTLDGEMLMICDGADEVAVAGVMGGENSEVSDTTVNVLIESAWFNPTSIRRTARALGLQTDASYRFERGVDPGGALRAASRAARLMVELGGGRIEDVVDAHPRPQAPRTLTLRSHRIARILGLEVDARKAADLLNGIEIVSIVDGDLVKCTVPTFRPDIEREIDLVEEVARRLGFDNIPAPHGTEIPYRIGTSSPVIDQRTNVLRFLSGLGFREIYTNSLVSPPTAARYATPLDPVGEPVETHNAISYEMSAVRSSLLPGGLQIVAHNLRHGFRDIRFVEFGHVFHKAGGPDDQRKQWVEGYVERESLILFLSGAMEMQGWDRSRRPVDVFDLKGLVDALFAGLGVGSLEYAPHASLEGVTTDTLSVGVGKTHLGLLGSVAEPLLKEFDIEQPVYFAEIMWADLIGSATSPRDRRYTPVSRFPSVERDLAIVVDKSVSSGSLISSIRESGSLLSSAEVFDVYEGPELGEGKKSIAVSLSFKADRTLVDREVDEEIERIVAALAAKWNAQLRAK